MRRTLEAAAVSYVLLTFAALLIPPGSSFIPVAAQPVMSALVGPPAVVISGGRWSSFALASAVVAVPGGIAWLIWRYDPATGVGLFWTFVAVLAWICCGLLAWASMPQ
jgi:hypothetical protein